jgi:heat shock protein HtpX
MNRSGAIRMSRSPSLVLRMVLVAVITPLAALALLALVVILMPGGRLWGLVIALGFGIFVRAASHRQREIPGGRVLAPADDPELFAVIDRLCLLAELRRPKLVLRNERQPNSWVVQMPRREPCLYLTTGLRELLTVEELTAVLAHELAHIANGDAVVMSVVGLPTSIMLGARGGGPDALVLLAIGAFTNLGTSLLSRYRELAADAGSAAITGRPSVLAAALLKVSDSLLAVPTKDLRAAAKLNAFNLFAIQPQGWWGRSRVRAVLFGTHPSLQSRLDALAELERDVHAGPFGPR